MENEHYEQLKDILKQLLPLANAEAKRLLDLALEADDDVIRNEAYEASHLIDTAYSLLERL